MKILTIFGCCLILGSSVHAVPIELGTTGHFYEYVHGDFSWDQANAAASAASHLALPGHLATISSAVENNFLLGLSGIPAGGWEGGWIGLYQPTSGPEPAGGWEWVTGEPFSFMSWGGGEPNDFGGVQDHGYQQMGGVWDDADNNIKRIGYFIEYESVPETGVSVVYLALGVFGLAWFRRHLRGRGA